MLKERGAEEREREAAGWGVVEGNLGMSDEEAARIERV